MPGLLAGSQTTANGQDRAKKRKFSTENGAKIQTHAISRKRAKGSPDTADDSTVESLEAAIAESQKHYNKIATLLTWARQDDKQASKARLALCRVFSRLQAQGRLDKARRDASESEEMISSWLRARAEEYRQILVDAIQDLDASRAERALVLAMQLVKQEVATTKTTTEHVWKSGTFPGYCDALLRTESGEILLEAYADRFVLVYDDIRQQTFHRVAHVCAQSPSEATKSNCLILLGLLNPPDENKKSLRSLFSKPTEADKSAFVKVSAHKKAAQQAWSAVMRSGLSKSQTKVILSKMTHNVVPWFASPELLMDFLTDAFDVGGATSLLALSGLFYLMQEKNLDYPAFYTKLYSLLDADLLHSKHRSRFFRLMDTFMSSTHLPANLVASFIKRLSRLALHGPPAGIVAVVPWIYNMFKSHPACTFLMHRVPRTPEQRAQIEELGAEEPFDPLETDPNHTGAIESCVWELVTLQSHYHPNVASLAKIISEQFTKASYNLEDFLDHSYNSLLEAELGAGELREVKKTPVVEFDIPKKVFVDIKGEPVLEGLFQKILDDN